MSERIVNLIVAAKAVVYYANKCSTSEVNSMLLEKRIDDLDEAITAQEQEQIAHLASSGPAGDHSISYAEFCDEASQWRKESDGLKAKLEAIEKERNDLKNSVDFWREQHDLGDKLRLMVANERDQWCKQTRIEVESRCKMEDERDTARQECEAQKARAIRAEGEARLPLRKAMATAEMEIITALTNELRRHGWSEAIFCPKDRSIFWGWDPLCAAPYECYYEGEWPKGSWFAAVHGDIWPARPVLWKAKS